MKNFHKSWYAGMFQKMTQVISQKRSLFSAVGKVGLLGIGTSVATAVLGMSISSHIVEHRKVLWAKWMRKRRYLERVAQEGVSRENDPIKRTKYRRRKLRHARSPRG